MHDIFLALWFFLPAGAANAAPIFVARVPALKAFNTPLDLGRTFRGRRLFGTHKTWRGLIAGVLVAVLVAWGQRLLLDRNEWLMAVTAPIGYTQLSTLLLGLLMGIGALGGDAVKSFFKRQNDTPPGASWFPFDQLDYILGATVLTLPIVTIPFAVYAWAIILWLCIHVVSTFIGYHLGLKEQPL